MIMHISGNEPSVFNINKKHGLLRALNHHIQLVARVGFKTKEPR